MTATLTDAPAQLSPPVDTVKLAGAKPGIYPYDVVVGKYAGRMAVYVPATFMPRLQLIPGALYSKADQVWTLPKAWPAVLALKTMSVETGLKLLPHPALKAWVNEQAGHWERMRELAARVDPTAVKAEDDVFYPHQEDDGEWLSYGGGIVPTRGRLLLNETGTGKTAAVLNGILKLDLVPDPSTDPDPEGTGHEPPHRPILVIAPKKTLKTAWADDLATFIPWARVEIIRGTSTQRRAAIERLATGEADIGIIGWEALRSHTRYAAAPGHALKKCEAHGGPPQSDEEHVTEAKCQRHERELNAIDFSLIVADELHRVLNNLSQTTQALWGLIRSAPDALRWGLTGTPISSDSEASWTVLHTADADAWPVKTTYVDYYLERGYSMAGFPQVFGFKPTRREEFQQVFSAMSRRRLKAEVLDLPPLLTGGEFIRECEMGREQAAAYSQMRDEMVLMVQEGKIVAANSMVATGRLSMLASATGYPDDPEAFNPGPDADDVPVKMLLRMPSCKIDSLVDDIRAGEFEGEQVAMSFVSRRFLRLVEQALVDTLGLDPTEIVSVAGDRTDQQCDLAITDFQQGKKRWMLYTYAAGGTGVTLTAASSLLRLERSWSPILWKQGLDRVHRIGSEKHKAVKVYDYVTTGTVEERQIDRFGENAMKLEELVQDQKKLQALFATGAPAKAKKKAAAKVTPAEPAEDPA